MKSHPQYLDPLTGNRLIQTLSDVKPSSTGLDGWSLAELVALSISGIRLCFRTLPAFSIS